jgi:hypothetical protein
MKDGAVAAVDGRDLRPVTMPCRSTTPFSPRRRGELSDDALGSPATRSSANRRILAAEGQDRRDRRTFNCNRAWAAVGSAAVDRRPPHLTNRGTNTNSRLSSWPNSRSARQASHQTADCNATGVAELLQVTRSTQQSQQHHVVGATRRDRDRNSPTGSPAAGSKKRPAQQNQS